jgi:peptidylprolyl isomerase
MPPVKRFALIAAACAVCLPFATLSGAAAQGAAGKDKPATTKAFKPKLDDPKPSEFRTVDPQNLLVVETTKGHIVVELVPEVAPQSVARIKELAKEHFYDGLTWHRVVEGFMAQGGDPKGDGSGGSTKPNVPAEFTFRRGPDTAYTRLSSLSGLEDGYVKSMAIRTQNTGLMIMTADSKVAAWGLWCEGVAGMARANAPDSGNSQFFLMRDFNAALEHNYTPFGRVLVGEDVVKKLKTGEPVTDPDKMTSVRLMSDLPAAQQQKIQVVDASSAWLQNASKYAFDACDIQLPVKVG